MELRLPKRRLIVITISVKQDAVFRVHEGGASVVHECSVHIAARAVARTLFLAAGGDGHAFIRDYAQHFAPPGVTYLPNSHIFISPMSVVKDDVEWMPVAMTGGKAINFSDGSMVIVPSGQTYHA